MGSLEIGLAGAMLTSLKGGVIAGTIALELTLAISMVKWGFENFDNQAEKLYGHIEGLSVWQKLNVFMNGIGKGFIDEIGKAFGEEDFAETGFQDLVHGTQEYFHTAKVNFDAWKKDMEMGWYLYWEDVKTNAGIWADDMLSEAVGFETSWAEFEDTVTDPEAWDQYWTNVKTGAQNWKDEMLKKFDELKTNVSNKITEMKDNAIKKFDEFKTIASQKIEDLKKKIGDKFGEIKKNITDRINEARDKVKEAIDKIKSFFSAEFKLKIKVPKFNIEWEHGDNAIGKAFQKLGLPGMPKLNIEWSEFANGGFPTAGEMFIAREAGPELVGTMSGRNAVANNAQIVEGIKQGVYEAVSQAMSQYGGVQIEARVDEGILLRKVQNQAQQYRMQTGKSPFPAI